MKHLFIKSTADFGLRRMDGKSGLAVSFVSSEAV